MALKKSDFTKMSWNEFGKRADNLYEKVKSYLDKNNLQLSAIAPILREGGFPGLYFAFKFNTLKIIPIQFKYFLKKGVDPFKQIPTQLTEIPKLRYDLPKEPVILLVDVLPGGGKTARAAGKAFRKRFPKCRLIYACLFKEYSFEKPDFFEVVIEGALMDETGKLSPKEQKKLGIDNTLYLLPWQRFEEETAALESKEYSYDF